jgi:hypothetical protein
VTAKKSIKSRSVKIDRNRYGCSRPSRTRPTLPVIVVVCDDTRTAVAYFNVLKRLVKDRLTLTVVPKPRDLASADDVVECAMAKLAELGGDQSHDDADQQSVWALIDLEATPAQHAAANQAKTKGEKSGIKIALSKPCYELWTLLHLIDTGEAFNDCSAVIARLEKEWQKQFDQPFGRKAQADYSKIIDLRMKAMKAARKHHESKDPSWTEVYRVIEEIEQFRAGAARPNSKRS